MIDKFYMCHYTKLTDRKEYAMKHLSQHKIDVKWITEFDKEDIDYEKLVEIFPNIFNIMPQFNRQMSKPEISLCLKHIEVFKDVIRNDYKNVVVFEDDILLVDNFIDKLESYSSQLPDEYDVLWLGSCCNLHAPQINGINIYPSRSSRCTHAYMISNAGCKKMLSQISHLNYPIDWFFNFVIIKLNMRNYWAEPDLAKQNDFFETTIQNSNK